jgi:hypothetical protein
MPETNPSWGKILELIESTLSIPKRTIELIAVKDILMLCASGVANHKIASVLELDQFYVKNVLWQFIEFAGWPSDLDLNPYSIYVNLVSKGYNTLEDFKKEVTLISPYMNDISVMEASFTICEKLYSIEQEIEKDWK